MKALLHYRPVFGILRIPTIAFLRLKFNFHTEKIEPAHRPYIVLSNHTTNYDPIMVGTSFPEHLHYIASDHVFRWGFYSRLIKLLADPIARLKSSRDVQTVIRVLDKLRKGYSICIFAEGSRTFCGETSDIPVSIGKLVSMSGASLITYRIDGGYFTNPRWGGRYRKGYMSGRKVREYSPQEIKKMTVDELNEVIKRDLYVNAFDEQRTRMASYHGKDIAENLEIALYMCPLCGSIGTLQSRRDRFFCSCGLHLRYTPLGLLESCGSGASPFNTVLDWHRWQRKKIVKKAEDFFRQFPDKPIFFDAAQSLWKIDKANRSELQGEGTLYCYKERLELKQDDGLSHSFSLEKIEDMDIYSRMVLIFSTADQATYEIKSDSSRSAVKYLDVFKHLKSKEARE
ncbi:MAG: 1-acyl-sn-glycerol-3-phosphate acyltransferase [Dehalococcoidales bacterium]|nr:1-acyl-sn-glycerol-3-phosphate acyltransferase [Dehalococcoidales bacterium]